MFFLLFFFFLNVANLFWIYAEPFWVSAKMFWGSLWVVMSGQCVVYNQGEVL